MQYSEVGYVQQALPRKSTFVSSGDWVKDDEVCCNTHLASVES